MKIEGKKISIIGAERSGVAAAKLAKRQGAVPFVSDSSNSDKLMKAKETLSNENISFEFGNHSDKAFECDFIVTSPGVPSDSYVLTNAKNKGLDIYSEVEFASWFCKASVISITGTNGKTTTTALCNYLLNEAGYKSYPAGNIGNAFSEIADVAGKDEFVSLETSSFQLDYIKNFKPKYAMILNITPDHLDRYEDSVEKYIKAKFKVFGNQTKDDFLILNADDINLTAAGENSEVNKYYFSTSRKVDKGAYLLNGKFFFNEGGSEEEICTIDDLFIKGEHNYANALAVLTAAKLVGVTNSKIKNAFSTFKGVEHRLELVAEINGVKFVNDSKATNVDSVWFALNSFEEKILLILGGKDKGNDYEQIKNLVEKNVKKIYAIGSSRDKIYEFFRNIVEVEKKDTLEECVTAGLKDAEKNEIVLLSPACASFDMFENYEHRGNVFKKAVMSLRK